MPCEPSRREKCFRRLEHGVEQGRDVSRHLGRSRTSSTEPSSPPDGPTGQPDRQQQRFRLRNTLWARVPERLRTGRIWRRRWSQYLRPCRWRGGRRNRSCDPAKGTHKVGMIMIEAGRVDALLVEQELDYRRCTAGIGLESFPDLSSNRFRDWRVRYGVPDGRATEQILRPRFAGLSLVNLLGMHNGRGFRSIRKERRDAD
jgi:hypothetical protein